MVGPLVGLIEDTVGAACTGGALSVSERVALVKLACVAVLLSVPRTVKVNVPLAVGVPVIAPLLLSVSPAGSAPLATVVENV